MAKKNTEELNKMRVQIDALEEQIRQAEMASQTKMEEYAPIKSIYKWKAPLRIFNPKGQSWYVTVAFVVIIVVAYSALTANFFLIIALIALLVLVYALNVYPPPIVEHEIINKGIKAFNKVYLWRTIRSFWITERSNHYLIHIQLNNERLPTFILLIGEGDPGVIVREMMKRIDYVNPGGSQNPIDRLVQGKHQPITKFLDIYAESEKIQKKLSKKTTKPARPRLQASKKAAS